MEKIAYMGYTFIPYGNISGKDEQTRFQRLMYRTNTLAPLLNKANGFDYYEFNVEAKAMADIYYCPETKSHYVPTNIGMCSIDVVGMRNYIRLLKQYNDYLSQSDDNMYSLTAIKKALGDDYSFNQSISVDEIKEVLETANMEGNDNVPIVLQAGNLDIELVIDFGEYENDVLVTPIHLEYFCCVRTNGVWESYDEIPDKVNLDVPDIEAEMFRVLSKFAEEKELSFFAQNDCTNQNRHRQSIDENEDEMER